MKGNFSDWKRFLGASLKRPNVGGVLLILDGDIEKIGGKAFCAAEAARSLAWQRKTSGLVGHSPSRSSLRDRNLKPG